MPPKRAPPPDAWDEDWEAIADKEDDKPEAGSAEPKLTKSQLKARHTELNRQIWDSAENPEPQWYPNAHDSVPIQSTFKPKVMMLARKPAPQVLSRNMASMNLDDEDSEEERKKKATADFEERKARAQLERAEKERKYAEARERIFGLPTDSTPTNSRSSSPSKSTRGKGQRRGGGGRDTQSKSSEQSPARATASISRQLYDPNYTAKPGSGYVAKKEFDNSRPATPNGQEKFMRQPQGPGRGDGRGFTNRGGHSPSTS